jgi:hypothetical protein
MQWLFAMRRVGWSLRCKSLGSLQGAFFVMRNPAMNLIGQPVMALSVLDPGSIFICQTPGPSDGWSGGEGDQHGIGKIGAARCLIKARGLRAMKDEASPPMSKAMQQKSVPGAFIGYPIYSPPPRFSAALPRLFKALIIALIWQMFVFLL